MKMNLIQPHRVENMKVELFQNVFLEMKKVSVTYPCLIWNVYKILLWQRCARSNFIHLSSVGRREFIILRRQFFQ